MVVVTHDPPDDWPRDGVPITFVSDGIGHAVAEASALAGDRVVAVDEHGHAHVEPRAAGIDRVFGRLLSIVARAQTDGSWERMKACPWHTCHVAFYDHSRNRSRTWCSMAVCGNRAKAQTYRRRGDR